MPTVRISDLGEGAHVTRRDGARLRLLIEEHWSADELVTLDFAGVRVASVSFFDEALGMLARAYGTEELRRKVRVQDIDPNDRALLNRIVVSRASEREASDGVPPANS